MIIQSTSSTYWLPATGMMRIEQAQGWRLDCEAGEVLVTQDGDYRDLSLSAGQSLVLSSRGRVLVDGVLDARFRLQPGVATPGPVAQLARVFGLAGTAVLAIYIKFRMAIG